MSRSRSGSNMNVSDRSGGVVMKAINFNTPNIPAISLGTLSNEGSLLMTNSTMGQRSIQKIKLSCNSSTSNHQSLGQTNRYPLNALSEDNQAEPHMLKLLRHRPKIRSD